MKKLFLLITLLTAGIFLTGCAGNQSVIWSRANTVDFSKGVSVELTSTVQVPEKEMEFIKKDIETKLAGIFKGDNSSRDRNIIRVTVTRYEEGNACARFFLIGMGHMYLYGDIKVTAGNPPVEIRTGEFRKKYSLGGIPGGMATMHNDMNSKIAGSIAEALKNDKIGE